MSRDSAKAERFLRHLEPLQGSLEAYCRRGLGDPSAIEDVLQNAVADAFRDFHLYVENTNFRAWIFRYLNLEILEANRRFARIQSQKALQGELSEAGSGAAEQQEQLSVSLVESLAESADAVLQHCDEALSTAVRQLDERDQSVLLLRAIGEFKYAEIAQILEIPVGTVMSSLSRSRKRLKEHLADFARRQGLLKGDV